MTDQGGAVRVHGYYVTEFEAAEMRRLGACPVCARCEAINTYRPGEDHRWHILPLATYESEIYRKWRNKEEQ
jgi:hypothetical protein